MPPFLHSALRAFAASLLALVASTAPVRAADAPAGHPAAVARAKADALLAARQRGDFAAMAKIASEGKPAGEGLSLRQVTQVEQSRIRIDGTPTSSRFVKEIAQPLGARTLVYETVFSKGSKAEEQVVTELRGGVPAVSGYTSVPCDGTPCVKP